MTDNMTPRERVYKALQFQDTDIIPYQVNFTVGSKEKMARYLGDEDFLDKLGNHLAILSHRKALPKVETEPGYIRDWWGVLWNCTVDKDIGVVENRVVSDRDLSGFVLPDPQPAELHEAYDRFIRSNPDKFRVATMGFNLFERAWSLRGMEMLLVDMIESPEFVHEFFDMILEYNMAQLELVLSYDVDGVLFGDDWGSQAGLIMGPGLWREFIKPRVARMYERVKDAGRFVFIHSCGDVRVILPELVDIGLNVFNPFQPEVMEPFETKKRYHGRLSFYGGISVQTLLPHGTPDEVREGTRRLLDELGKGGGYIASPSHDIPVDVPVENIAAMVEVLQNQ